jgi:hypothetical protein
MATIFAAHIYIIQDRQLKQLKMSCKKRGIILVANLSCKYVLQISVSIATTPY